VHAEGRRTSGGAIVSPFQGTPNMPLHELSITNACVPLQRSAGGMMYSTRRSPPPPPVMPARARACE
jgi:hypothetical protein